MQLESLAYTPNGGWSIQPFPDLDSDRTLVYGEIAPYSTGRPDLHNQTMNLTMISEA